MRNATNNAAAAAIIAPTLRKIEAGRYDVLIGGEMVGTVAKVWLGNNRGGSEWESLMGPLGGNRPVLGQIATRKAAVENLVAAVTGKRCDCGAVLRNPWMRRRGMCYDCYLDD